MKFREGDYKIEIWTEIHGWKDWTDLGIPQLLVPDDAEPLLDATVHVEAHRVVTNIEETVTVGSP